MTNQGKSLFDQIENQELIQKLIDSGYGKSIIEKVKNYKNKKYNKFIMIVVPYGAISILNFLHDGKKHEIVHTCD